MVEEEASNATKEDWGPAVCEAPNSSEEEEEEEEMDTDEALSEEEDEEIDVEVEDDGPYDLSMRRMWRPW